MRIFRKIVVLTALVLLIPDPPEGGMDVASAPSTPEMLGSALSAVADVRGFCGRQPGFCDAASYVAGRLEVKAKHGARLIYEWASEGSRASSEPNTATAVDVIETGSTSPAPFRVRRGQNTLTLEDLIPEWRGPVPKKKA